MQLIRESLKVVVTFKKNKKIFFILCSFLWLAGCQQNIMQPRENTKLGQLQELTQRNVHYGGTSGMLRTEAIKETALSVAAQAGLAARSEQLNMILKKNERRLDQVYNFNLLLLKNNVMPPILSEGDDTMNIANNEALRISDRVFRTIRQAHFVSTPPTWRDYIQMNYKKPDPPDPSLLPKNRQEVEVWKKYTKSGWENGTRQAETIFIENLQRLQRDYKGLILYRKLLAQNMVSAPFVATTELGVTGGGGEMRVNDQVLRITALSNLNPNSAEWKAPLEAYKAQETQAQIAARQMQNKTRFHK